MPDRPWSPIEIEQRMADCIEKLEDAVTRYKALGYSAAQKKRDYEVEQAKCMLLAARHRDPTSGERVLTSDTLRKAWVTEQVADLEQEADIAEHQVRAARMVISQLETEAELLRSMARSSRDMHDQPGYGGRP